MKETKGYGILYTSLENFELIRYTDSDWVGSVDDRKSTSRYVFHLGSRAILLGVCYGFAHGFGA